MSKSSSKTPVSTATPKKRRRCTDPVEVSCRLRPLLSTDSGLKCIERVSETTLKITAPPGSQGYRSNPVSLFYSFNNIFSEEESQKSVFDKLALPLVEDLIKGKNGLLFAYGVTCSGKTHTMIGQSNNPGILPRCLDAVFNTIGDNHARPYIFMPDDTNGMKIQPEYQAALMKNQIERHKRQQEKLRKRDCRPGTPEIKADEIRIPDSTKLDCVDEDSAYAVFISYIEVYNNYIFDLLDNERCDEYGQPVLPESKKVGEDSKRKVMYVKDVVEQEVKSTEEACSHMWKGQERRRKAATILNDRSSRSHSVFNIRIVQAPYDEGGEQLIVNKDRVTISQLSLVDLAGSERPSKSNATGGTLKEAGNINNSLMTLHSCLEILRSNQLSGRATRMVPYRESRLTLLFKNYFEGEGRVRMAVCVNPRNEDYDETAHVMKFAEMTQDVVVNRGQEVQFDENVLQPGRRKQNLLYKRISQGGEPLADLTNRHMNSFGFNLPTVPPAFCLPPFPSWSTHNGSSEDKLQAVLAALHERQKMKKDALEDFEKRKQRMRAVLVQMEKENEDLYTKTSQGTTDMSLIRQEFQELRRDYMKLEKENLKQKREIERLKKQNHVYYLESSKIIEEKEKTEEKIRKEVLRREKMQKQFKGVVGREKEKWEKTTEHLIRRAELGAARQESKLRQVLEIVGGNPDVITSAVVLERPIFQDIIIPSCSSVTSSELCDTSPTPDTPSHDQYGYKLPFKNTKSRIDKQVKPASYRGGTPRPVTPTIDQLTPIIGPVTPSSAGGILPSLSSKPITLSPGSKPSLLAPSSKAGLLTPKPPCGGIKVLPSSPIPPRSDTGGMTPDFRHRPPNVVTPTLSHKPASEHTSVISRPQRTRTKAKSPHSEMPQPTECVITADHIPEFPLKARIPKATEHGAKWLNHRPPQNLEEVNILKPSLLKKKTVPIPDVADFDSETNRYLLHHQEQDSLGEIRTHFIKGDIKVSRGGGRIIEFTDIETSSKNASAKLVLGHKTGTYPPPNADSGDWTDTETRCTVGVGIPTAKTKPLPFSR